MSVQSNQYLMFGIKFPMTDSKTDPFERYEDFCDSAFKGIQHHRGLCVLYDGMNGEYIAIGRVLAKSDCDRPLDGETCLSDLQPSSDVQELTTAAIEREFDIPNPDCKVWLITYYR